MCTSEHLLNPFLASSKFRYFFSRFSIKWSNVIVGRFSACYFEFRMPRADISIDFRLFLRSTSEQRQRFHRQAKQSWPWPRHFHSFRNTENRIPDCVLYDEIKLVRLVRFVNENVVDICRIGHFGSLNKSVDVPFSRLRNRKLSHESKIPFSVCRFADIYR